MFKDIIAIIFIQVHIYISLQFRNPRKTKQLSQLRFNSEKNGLVKQVILVSK